MVAWKSSLVMRILLVSKVGAFNHLKQSSNKVEGDKCRREQKWDHISAMYVQSKNKCCMHSSKPEHIRQLGDTSTPQPRILSHEANQFQATSHEMKACFGTRSLNQICECQDSDGPGRWRVIQVFAVEKRLEDDCTIGVGEGRHCFSKVMIAFLLRKALSHHLPFTKASAIVASLCIPRLMDLAHQLDESGVLDPSNYHTRS